ncbi:MAG: nucleoside triphosphate pyrophosphohydrolase [Candidatus Moranbacteria bacterium]|nr:nucleoside triphosphate pyrophosphohydrolase [Candidatus Moranbacteria bacterium]
MKFNKLVRDKIPEIIKSNGENPITHIADEEEYNEALMNKLHEEVTEFLEDPSLEELADIIEVLNAICAFKNIDLTKLEEVQERKFEECGGFEEDIILDEVER